MSNATENKKTSKLPVFWISFLGSIVVLWLLIVIQPEREQVDPKHLPWNAHIDSAGKLHALGLIVGESNLQDAMNLYGKDVEVKIFSDKDESNKSLEAFFPVMYIGSIKGGLAVKIEADEQLIEEVYANGKKTTPTTSGKREVELYYQDAAKFFAKPISSVTLVPRKNLTDRAIAMRFGEPDRKEVQSDGLAHWFYKQRGLELIIDQDGPEALQFYQN